MSDSKTLSGQVHIADEVIANIVGTAVMETEGVVGMSRHLGGRKKAGKGITLQIDNDNLTVSIAIVIKSGVKIQDVAADAQQKVKTAIETMTSYTAREVNIHVTELVA